MIRDKNIVQLPRDKKQITLYPFPKYVAHVQVNKAKTFALYSAINHGINCLHSEYYENNNQCLFLKRKVVIING